MLPHAHPSVCSLPVHTLSRNVPCALLQALPVPSTISAGPSPFAAALPALHSVPNCHSNPITQRVRRKRQRLPPSLLIENASNVILPLPENSSPGAFPIKASDHPGVIAGWIVSSGLPRPTESGLSVTGRHQIGAADKVIDLTRCSPIQPWRYLRGSVPSRAKYSPVSRFAISISTCDLSSSRPNSCPGVQTCDKKQRSV